MFKLEDIQTIEEFYSYIKQHNEEKSDALNIGDIVYTPYLKPFHSKAEAIVGILLSSKERYEILVCEESALHDGVMTFTLTRSKEQVFKNVDQCLESIYCEDFDALNGVCGAKCSRCERLLEWPTSKGTTFYCSKMKSILEVPQYV